MNTDEELKKLTFRIGSEISNLAKDKTAPIGKYPPSSNKKGGNLKTDIGVRKVNPKSVIIGNTMKAEYAKFVHEGTKPYIIKPKNKKVLANKEAGVVFGKKVNHPGIKANPYLKIAANEYKENGGLGRALKSFSSNLMSDIVSNIKKDFKNQ